MSLKFHSGRFFFFFFFLSLLPSRLLHRASSLFLCANNRPSAFGCRVPAAPHSLYAAHCFALCVSVCLGAKGAGRNGRVVSVTDTHARTCARTLACCLVLCVCFGAGGLGCVQNLFGCTEPQIPKFTSSKNGHRRSNSKIINSHFSRLEYILQTRKASLTAWISLLFFLLTSVESYTFEMPLRRVNRIPLVSSPLSRHQHACHQNPRQGGPAGPA